MTLLDPTIGAVSMASELSAAWALDGDWTRDPWFLDGEDDVFQRMGFPLDVRRRAAASLARLYDPSVCRDIRDNPRRGHGSVVFLFHRWWPGVLVSLLDVGLDLADVRPWGDARLLKRLTRRDEFQDASLELHVLANLIRSNYRATRIQEAQNRSPDLSVRIGLEDYEVEVKSLHGSPLLEADEVVNEALMRQADLMVEGLHLELVGSRQLHLRALTDLPGLVAELPQIVAAFDACVSRIRQTGGNPGRYDAAPFGSVLATAEPGLGSMTPNVLPDLPPEKRVNKAVRLVRVAAKQFTKRRGIVVLGLRRSADILNVAEAIKRTAVEERPALDKCHMVVLVDSVRDASEQYRNVPVVHIVQVHPRRQLTKAQERFAAVAGGDRRTAALMVRPTRPGEAGFRIGIERRGVTKAVIGPDGKLDITRRLPGAHDAK